jgi:hypothetical protein
MPVRAHRPAIEKVMRLVSLTFFRFAAL